MNIKSNYGFNYNITSVKDSFEFHIVCNELNLNYGYFGGGHGLWIQGMCETEKDKLIRNQCLRVCEELKKLEDIILNNSL